MRKGLELDNRSSGTSFGEQIWGKVGAEVGQQWAEGQIKGGGAEGARSSSLCVSSSYQYVPNGRMMTGTQRFLPRERWGCLRTFDYFLAKKLLYKKK